MNRIGLIVLLGLFSLKVLATDELKGKVTSVIDGNTLEVEMADGENYKIQLLNVDCPEIGQQYGIEAKKFTTKLVKNKKVMLQIKGRDRYGNRLAVVRFSKNKVLNEILVEEGYAWREFRSKDQKLARLQSIAKRGKRGLWEFEEPTPPWIYRRRQSMLTPKGR